LNFQLVKWFRKTMAAAPALVRALPIAIFLALTFCQDQFGEAGRYWCYLVKTVVGAWLIWMMRPFVPELRWKISGGAVLVGVAVFGIWVGLDGFYPQPGKTGPGWNPHPQFGEDSTVAWFFILTRIIGSSIVVPPLEEVFYRSFLYRYLARSDFQSLPLGSFVWVPFLATAAIFGLSHHEWLAGILCGFAYQGLVIWKQRLGDAITAHAITNFLLGLWVVSRSAWHFW
jgi:uncharacterized protein